MRFKDYYIIESIDTNNTLYHSTTSSNAPLIINNGFKVNLSGKNKYGVGVYGTTDVKSQHSDLQSGNYGDIILKSIYPDSKIMIFDKDHTPIEEFGKYFDISDYPEEVNTILSQMNTNNPVFNAQMFSAIQKKYPDIWKSLDGIIVDDRGTNIIVYYKPEKLTITHTSSDGGETWKPINKTH